MDYEVWELTRSYNTNEVEVEVRAVLEHRDDAKVVFHLAADTAYARTRAGVYSQAALVRHLDCSSAIVVSEAIPSSRPGESIFPRSYAKEAIAELGAL